MGQGVIHVYSGDGHGKSSAALGKAVQAASIGKSVVIIQFLKGLADNSFIKRLEPEIKFFRFEKSDADFNLLSEAEKVEEIQNIKNGLNFAKKVLATGGCDLLIVITSYSIHYTKLYEPLPERLVLLSYPAHVVAV